MKAFSGFKAEASGKKSRMLPAGAYVAKIKSVVVEGNEPDQRLRLRVDVDEGPYARYFYNRYMSDKQNSRFEPKYKGDFYLRIPNDENTKAMYPETDLKRFNDAIYRIEQSNPGYHWDWNENGLVGLLVGINMQPGECNGYAFTRIGRLEIVDEVRAGVVQPMQAREQKGDADDSTFIDKQSGFVGVETEELPFD